MFLCRDELIVGLADGWLRRIHWDGSTTDDVDASIQKVPFYYDQLQSKAEYVPTGVWVRDLAFSPLVGGFSAVLSTGQAAVIVMAGIKLNFASARGIWVPRVANATCTTINHRYRLILIGHENSHVTGYSIEETTGAIVLVFDLALSPTVCGEVASQLGPVTVLRLSPCGSAVAVAWSRRGMAIWSTFGALLWCSESETQNVATPEAPLLQTMVSDLDWGHESFDMWIAYRENRGGLPGIDKGRVGVMSFLRHTSSGSTNFKTHNILLMGEDRLYLSRPCITESVGSIANNHWEVICVPHEYLGNAWPLRYCSLSQSDRPHVCIAGTQGLAWYSTRTRKWKLFGNESQEREMVVSGGLVWWGEFMVAPCYNVIAKKDELRIYPSNLKMDNAVCSSLTLENQVLLMSLKGDVLILLDIFGKISLYSLASASSSPSSNTAPQVIATKHTEIIISELIPHPACIISVQMASLSLEPDAPRFFEGADTLFLNVAGKLIMLRPTLEGGMTESSPTQPAAAASLTKHSQLNPPMLVASCVEEFWCQFNDAPERPHLSQALWIQCGGQGLKVWMPLFPKDSLSNNKSSFISKRIMLPLELSVRPLILINKQCIALGVENYARACCLTDYSSASPDDGCQPLPPLIVHGVTRKSEVYLHHILRQLLKRNLGLYALQIAGTCRDLSYFSHVLELLLHVVLEEEATSSEPIPDPLLPRVVAFIQEFPEFLDVITHCARKTEINLWPHLFRSVGDPKGLFEVCIRETRLETAASFLIILQNLEPGSASQELAASLLESSLVERKWEIARDIVRFLSAIDPKDMELPLRARNAPVKGSVGPRFSVSSPVEFDEELDSIFFRPHDISRQRNYSVTSGSDSPPEAQQPPFVVASKNSGASTPTDTSRSQHGYDHITNKKQTLKKSASDPRHSPMHRRVRKSGDNGNTNTAHFYLDLILRHHARKLLENGSLADLGSFSAHLDFHLVLWLSKERDKAARVKDWIGALEHLHSDFSWPYPAVGSYQTSPSSFGSRASDIHSLRVITAQESIDSGFPQPIIQQNLNSAVTMAAPSALYSTPPPPAPLTNGIVENDIENMRQSSHSGSIAHTKQLLIQQQQGNLGLRNNFKLSSPVATVDAVLEPRSPESEAPPTEITEEDDGSVFGNHRTWDDQDVTGNHNGPLLEWEALDQICNDMMRKGPAKCEAQLRFLQQVFSEAGCTDWVLLICILLRDLVALARHLNPSTIANLAPDTLRRLRGAVACLDAWAERECYYGYSPILGSVKRHLDLLSGSRSSVMTLSSISDVECNNSGTTACSASCSTSDSSDETTGFHNDNHRALDYSTKARKSNKSENGFRDPLTRQPGTSNVSDGKKKKKRSVDATMRSETLRKSFGAADNHIDLVGAYTPSDQKDCRIS